MEHKLHEVRSFKVLRPYTLEIEFDDGLRQEVDFDGVLEGELYGPLRDPTLFTSVRLDPELGNLVWPNGADFDPEILHDWPERRSAMIQAATQWRNYTPVVKKRVRPGPWSGFLQIVWYIAIGFCAGAIAKFVLHTHLSPLATILLGIVGSVLGGVLAHVLSSKAQKSTGVQANSIHFAGALVGAIILLVVSGNLVY
jgi:uncharacterized membrane protein YeaQ/YmgE (transglycosylase-associated protein family)